MTILFVEVCICSGYYHSEVITPIKHAWRQERGFFFELSKLPNFFLIYREKDIDEHTKLKNKKKQTRNARRSFLAESGTTSVKKHSINTHLLLEPNEMSIF